MRNGKVVVRQMTRYKLGARITLIPTCMHIPVCIYNTRPGGAQTTLFARARMVGAQRNWLLRSQLASWIEKTRWQVCFTMIKWAKQGFARAAKNRFCLRKVKVMTNALILLLLSWFVFIFFTIILVIRYVRFNCHFTYGMREILHAQKTMKKGLLHASGRW